MADGVTVTVEAEVDGTTLERFRDLYRRAFDPLRTLSAARQVLTDDEFSAEMVDPRVDKYVAWEEGEPVGLSTLTRELETVPWISPEYFRARFPQHAERDALFYLGFALADPERRQLRAFAAMASAVVTTLSEAGGVCGYDVCAYNRDEVRFADNLERFMKRQAPAVVNVVDSQTYYTVDLAAALEPTTRSGAG